MEEPLAALPDDVMYEVFDRVTRKGDWAGRLGLLLTVPALRSYSRSVRHMRIVLERWHSRGCSALRARIQSPLPTSLTPEWLERIVALVGRKPDPIRPEWHDYLMVCSLCGRTAFPCLTM